jgi:hypothetical protein
MIENGIQLSEVFKTITVRNLVTLLFRLLAEKQL